MQRHARISVVGHEACLFFTVLLLLATSVAADEHIVNTNGLVFEPAVLNIQVGDTVTWINADNGLHNVVADDGTFSSGAPSTATWQYSYTFHTGGSWDYSCEVHVDQGMTGTINVEGIFGDGLEAGGTLAWDDNETGLPLCHCYFSGDCADLEDFCNWGSLFEEDNCQWRKNKPNGVPGAGCDVEFPGTSWESGICDGICTPKEAGSDLGLEDQDLLIYGIQIWTEALLGPAEAGGGQVDPELSQEAMGLSFRGGQSAMILGRQLGDMLASAGIRGIDRQYCHHESHPGEDSEITPDLSNDPCRLASGRLSTEALVAEILQPGSALGILEGVRDSCRGDQWQGLFVSRCPVGPDAIECFSRRISALAHFLSTPPSRGPLGIGKLQRTPSVK